MSEEQLSESQLQEKHQQPNESAEKQFLLQNYDDNEQQSHPILIPDNPQQNHDIVSSRSKDKKKKSKKDRHSSVSKEHKKSKVKKTQHRCILCRTQGKTVDMRKCTSCKHYSHLSCLQQEQLPQNIKYICQKCKNLIISTKNKAEIKHKKRQQKQLCTKLDQKKLQKERKKKQIRLSYQKFKGKYPYYIVQGDKIKFPIEDKLFLIYHELFEIPQLKLSVMDHDVIPGKYLGDFLFIQDFIVSYGKDIEKDYNGMYDKSKIYSIMNCIGSDRVFQTLIGAIIKIYLKDIFQKNKTQNIKILNENAFFILIGLLNQAGILTSNYIALVCRQVLRQLTTIPSMKNSFDNLTFPEKLNLQTKIELIIKLIDGLSQVDAFHDMVSSKSQRISELTRFRTDCIAKLKTNEAEALCNKQKLKQMLGKTNTQNKEQNSEQKVQKKKQASKQKQKKKKISQKLSIQGEISQKVIKDYKLTIQSIGKQIPFIVSEVISLGKDRNQSNYYFYNRQPNRIYIRLKDYVLDESNNYKYLQTKQKIWQFMRSLNQKGINQKKLYDTINNLIKQQIIRNQSQEEITKQKQSQVPIPTGECVFVNQQTSFRLMIIKDMLEIQQSFSNYLAIKNYRWGSEIKREQFRFGFPYIQERQALKEQIRILHQNFLFVQVTRPKQTSKHQDDSNQDVEPFNQNQKQSNRKKKPIRIWGINSERTKKFWSEYLQSTINFTGLWICVDIFKNYINKYLEKKYQNIREQQRKIILQKQKQERKKKAAQQSQKRKDDKNQNKFKGRSRPKKVTRKSILQISEAKKNEFGVKTRRSAKTSSKMNSEFESSDQNQSAQDEQYKVDQSS